MQQEPETSNPWSKHELYVVALGLVILIACLVGNYWLRDADFSVLQ